MTSYLLLAKAPCLPVTSHLLPVRLPTAKSEAGPIYLSVELSTGKRDKQRANERINWILKMLSLFFLNSLENY